MAKLCSTYVLLAVSTCRQVKAGPLGSVLDYYSLPFVIAGLDQAIHLKKWMPGSRLGMTRGTDVSSSEANRLEILNRTKVVHVQAREKARRPVSRVLSPQAGDGHSSGTSVTGRLARPTRAAARKPASGLAPRCRPYLVLLPVGFALPSPLPATRCALTAPFHPYPSSPRKAQPGGLLSVALSLGSPPPGVTRHRVPVEPGLSSPRAGHKVGHERQPSGRLAPPMWRARRPASRNTRRAIGYNMVNILIYIVKTMT